MRAIFLVGVLALAVAAAAVAGEPHHESGTQLEMKVRLLGRPGNGRTDGSNQK